MACARVRAIMQSLTLVHYRYVHMHNHGISKTKTSKNVYWLSSKREGGDSILTWGARLCS